MTTALSTQVNAMADPFLAIERAKLSDTTRRQYRRALELYLATGNSLTNADQLATYAQGLKSSPKSFLKSAIRLWSLEMARATKAQANPENVASIQAVLYRLESLTDAIQVETKKGSKPHNWLSGSQIKHLREVIDNPRDYLIISLMLQAGLRRDEVCHLKYTDVQMLGDMPVLVVCGKGNRTRTIPITAALAERLKTWPGKGEYVIGLSGQSIMDICRRYGRRIDLPSLSPHDCRRTFAQTALTNGVSINQISALLGHSSINTTARYLDLDTQKLPTIGAYMQF